MKALFTSRNNMKKLGNFLDAKSCFLFSFFFFFVGLFVECVSLASKVV